MNGLGEAVMVTWAEYGLKIENTNETAESLVIYSQHDLGKYLEKEYKVSRSDVFAKVKAVNKRRKKLYDSEYVTEVCKQFDLNPVDVVAGLKKRFVTYRAFSDYIRR